MKNHLLKGQTIMEMLVVFFIISTGLYGAVTLIFSNLALQEKDHQHIIAMNLAREGLEIVQNVRDSNWLAGVEFDAGLGTDTGVDCTAVPNWTGTTSPSFDFSIDDISSAGVNRSNNPASSGMLTHSAGTSTGYARLITFSPICADPADRSLTQVSTACLCTDPTFTEKIGLRAQALISWTSKSGPLSLTIYSDLYDWR